MSNPIIASRFDEIYSSTSKAVLAFITAKCKNTSDIADIFQDTYLELYQALIKRGAGYIKNEKAFAMHVAKQKIAKHYSLLDWLRIFVSLNASNEYEEEVDLSDFETDGLSLEDSAVNQVLLDDARKLIQSKAEDVKKVFYLFYDVGLTIPEIARALALSESGVKNKLYRTIKELRDLLS